VIASDLPDAPANPPNILTLTKTSVTILLDQIPLSSNGGSSITGYIVLIDDGLGGSFK
jgi:hypothetical protein